nr:transcription factor DIVARICATA-like [Ipomoea batatas]
MESLLISSPSWLIHQSKSTRWTKEENKLFESALAMIDRGRSCDHERKKGVPWTEEEHRRFLMGLQKYGKGDWRNISRNFVISKTPTQVASHAQKYFLRQHSGGKDKRRPSIHDITTVNVSDATLLHQRRNVLSWTRNPRMFLFWSRGLLACQKC